MRIALVSHYMPPHIGGLEQVADLLARTYAEAGHEVTWIACADPARAGDERDGRLRRVRIPASNVLERRFAMPFPLPSPSGWRTLSSLVASADVVHVHDCLYLTSVAADRAARHQRIPVLVTQHVAMVSFKGGLADPFLGTAYRTVGKGVLERAAHVAFVSDTVREWFARRVSRAMRGSVVPNAVDTSLFRPASAEARAAARAELGVATDAKVVLFAGRLVPKKRIRALVEALPSDAQLVVVGDGPERGALLPLGRRVTHVHRLPHARVREAYAAADVFVLPSYGEGLPIALIEALASGLLCVVSDDPAFAPLAACAAVVPAPVSSLSGALRTALQSTPTERTERGVAGRAFVLGRYGVDAFRERYLALITECATSAARAR